MDYSTLTDGAWERRDDGTLTLSQIPETWLQGRTLFGAGMAGSGLRMLLTPERTPRVVHVNFVGPISGATVATPTILREGRSVTHGEVRFHQEDTLRGQVLVTMGGPRESVVSVDAERAEGLPDVDDAALMEMPFIPGMTPNFTQNFVYRWASQSFPYSGATDPSIRGWCRFREDAGAPHVALLGLADSWPSPALPMLKGPAPSSSVTWTTHFVNVPEAVTPDDWFWMDSVVTQARDGYVRMEGKLYDRQGVMVLRLEQLVAVFG